MVLKFVSEVDSDPERGAEIENVLVPDADLISDMEKLKLGDTDTDSDGE